MINYLVVTGVDKSSGFLHIVEVDAQAFVVRRDYGYAAEQNLCQFVAANKELTPLNFSVGQDGKIQQNCGDFSRFSPMGSAVVLAEIKSQSGRTLGYRLLSCANNACVNMKTEEIVAREQSYADKGHFLQNGIVRNKAVACYPSKPFPVIIRELGKKPHKSTGISKDVRKVFEDAGAVRKSKPPVTNVQFTKEQLQELSKCKEKGVNPQIIYNPELSPQQMRVLWVAKSNGCLSESFADPRISVDAMKFYADRLYSVKLVGDCREMLAHPELGVDELSELYACVCAGVPYSAYIGMSAVNIGIERERATATYWDNSPFSSFDWYKEEKVTDEVMRLRGML